MGARANVVLYNETKEGYEYSPVIYTHWGGYKMNDLVQSYIDMYHNDDSDLNMEPAMRLELDRCFPVLARKFDNNVVEYCIFNFDNAKDFADKLPSANDMPIIADDYGLYLINIRTMTAHNSAFDWAVERT